MAQQTSKHKNRLSSLERQFYGKSVSDLKQTSRSPGIPEYSLDLNKTANKTPRVQQEMNHLKTDLLKIAMLTFLVLAVQFVLFTLIQRNLVHIKFF